MKRLLIALVGTMLAFAASQAVAQLTTTFAGGKAGGSGPPPVCAGVIDASIGCPLPMLGM